VALLAEGASGLAAALLSGDPAGWFLPGRREPAIRAAFSSALEWLTQRLGSDMKSWAWGRLHTLPLRHFLSGRGDLAALLDHGGAGVGGDFVTVNNTGPNADFEARSGAGYRLVVDLDAWPATLWAIDAQSQSGHPGSPHYADQLDEWLAGRYHPLPLDRWAAAQTAESTLVLEPGP
jgi:penicillin amidase